MVPGADCDDGVDATGAEEIAEDPTVVAIDVEKVSTEVEL